MAAVCKHFVQNAWKKDLCSNCFKSKEEHGGTPQPGPMWCATTAIPQGILRVSQQPPRRPKGTAVRFPAKESHVIGFGGDECFSSDEGEECGEASGDTPPGSEDEEERALQKLTRSNTDFNTSARPFNSLLLGQPRRETLLVTVKPFGDSPDKENVRPAKTVLDSAINKVKPQLDSPTSTIDTENTQLGVKPCADSGTTTEKGISCPATKPVGDLIAVATSLADSDTTTTSVTKSSVDNATITTSLTKSSVESVTTTTALAKSLVDSAIPTISAATKPLVDNGITKTPLAKPFADSIFPTTTAVAKPLAGTVAPIMSAVAKPSTTVAKPFSESVSPTITSTTKHTITTVVTKPFSETVTPIVSAATKPTSTTVVSKPFSESVTPSITAVSVGSIQTGLVADTNKPVSLADIVKPEEKAFSRIPVKTRLEKPKTVIRTAAFNGRADLPDLSRKTDDVLETHNVEIKMIGSYKKLEEPIIIQDGEYKASKVMVFPVQESRELAGEPDGRADCDEPPELPRSPPPTIDPRPSFLHGLVQRKTLPLTDKPKIPVKPNKVLQANRKPLQVTPVPVQSEILEECSRTPKRQAPKPPQPEECPALPLFTRNPSASHSKSNSPVTREKEKRERASSCTPKPSESPAPEPAPRRSLSLSVESLTSVPVEPDKKKIPGRARFSLRKFLRFGQHKDEDKTSVIPTPPRIDNIPVVAPLPRPRLEIIHPSDLTGTAVEVVKPGKQIPEDNASTSSGSTDSKETETMSCDSSNSSGSPTHSTTARPNKPPPPPRNQSLDAWGKTLDSLNKPARPPPPKSAELLRQQKQAAMHTPSPTVTDNLYANLALIVTGEVRSGLAPNKPQRTASIRDASTDGPRCKVASSGHGEDSGYESVELVNGKPVSQPGGENVYESVGGRSSSPECDAGIVKTPSGRYNQHRRSDGTIDTSSELVKLRASFVRSTSLPYCGSETESDIYSPYSFYGSEEGGEEDTDWSAMIGHPVKMSRLKLRKGRSIVHKSLEDNYGAVIVANHEALSQVLEQVNVGMTVPIALRGLKTAAKLRWSDFAVLDDSRGMMVGRRAFHAAQWMAHAVTLCLTVDQGLPSGLPVRGGSSSLMPITEFSDLVPARLLPASTKLSTDMVQASVAVLTKMQVDTVKSLGASLRGEGEEQWKEGSFVLLQLVNGLKMLQAQGIEEVPASLSSFVLCREDRDPQPRLCVLHELNAGVSQEETLASLCRCGLAALSELLPSSLPLARLVGDLLARERAGSLSQVKSVLEFSLWGPADVALGAPRSDRELALQRWLDLERATVLHGLVRTRIDLTPFEECHLLFLVRTNAKMMSEASLLLDSFK